MATAPVPWQLPSRPAAVWRKIKVGMLVLRQVARNWRAGAPRRHARGDALMGAPVRAEVRSSLWTDGRPEEFVLVCGKVQNLRVALRAFHGVEVPAGETFSFWRQLGHPGAYKGFVPGREVVAGCVVPTVAGGLCQLSNALATAAASAGIGIAERHAHTARIEGAAPGSAVDATVAWNYVDLKLRADFDFRMEVELTHDQLLLRLKSRHPEAARMAVPIRDPRVAEPAVARGCLSCAETSCFRHRPADRPAAARHAALVDSFHPELQAWLAQQATHAEGLVPWVRAGRRQQAWRWPVGVACTTVRWPAWVRTWELRRLRGEGGALQRVRMAAAQDMAQAYARRLQPLHVDLTVTQELLVPLWRRGVLGGRHFDVFVHQLPASEIQLRLDAAAALHPGADSLTDFRADAQWLRDEWAALRAARARITAHADVARVLEAAGLSCSLVPWVSPPPHVAGAPTRATAPALVLPASALARKGALEVAQVARQLQLPVWVLGSPPADLRTWDGVDLRLSSYRANWCVPGHVVVLPAFVEHMPRALLRARDAGLPVLASAACGVPEGPGLTWVTPGRVDELVGAVRRALSVTAA